MFPSFDKIDLVLITNGAGTDKLTTKAVAKDLRDNHGWTVKEKVPGVKITWQGADYYVKLADVATSVADALGV